MFKKKETQTETNTENSSKKHRVLKIIVWALIIAVSLGVVAFIVLNILITDKNKNKFVDSGISNQQLINKDFVEALSSMNDSFEFKLSNEDVNQMLSNSLKNKEVSSFVNLAYLSIDNQNNFKWCFDLSLPVFSTRLIVNTHIELMGNSYVFSIDSMTMGKLNTWSILQSGGYISDDAFNSLFSNASLPIESHLENGFFLYSPTKFIEMFNLGEVPSELFTLVNSPERLSVETDTIGFKLNLEGIRVASPAEITGSYDLPGELEAIVNTNERYNSLSIGVETSILEVGEEDFSKWIKDCCTKTLSLETIESDLVNTKITSSIASVAVKFTNNEFVVHWLIKLGNTYFEVEESLGAGFDDDAFTLTFMRPLNESQLQMLLMDDFISNFVNTGYASYLESNKSITLDFSSVSMTSSVENLAFKRLGIVNNKLTFFLEKCF